MKHLEDLQEDIEAGYTGSDKPQLLDTRMEGILKPEEIHKPPEHTHYIPEEPPYKKPTLGMAKTFFILALLFFIGAVGYFVYVFGQGAGSISEKNVTVEIVGSSFVTSGAESSYELIIQNSNNADILNVIAEVEVPSSSSSAPQTFTQSIGTIEARSQGRATFPVTVFGAQFDDKDLIGRVKFSFPGSRAQLSRESLFSLRIAQSPVSLEITSPERLVVGQETTVAITMSSSSVLTNVGMKIEYPEGFQVLSTSTSPAAGNYFWEYSRLPANKQIELKITGKFNGIPIEGTVNAFRVSVGSLSRDERILSNIFATKSTEVQVGQSGINAVLLIAGNSESKMAVFPGSDIIGQIVVTNTTDQPIRNISLILQILGQYIDLGRSKPGTGTIDSSQRSIVYSFQDNNPELELLAPGATTRLSFTLGGNQNWVGADMGGIAVSVRGQSQGGDIISASNIDEISFQQSAKLGLVQKTLYESGAFENFGPLPPKVDSTTTYTIVWSLPRQVIDFKDVKVTATLPLYVEWLNNVFPASAPVTYDEATRTITWNQGLVQRTSLNDPTVHFKVSVRPSIQHQNTTPAIVENVTLSGLNPLVGENFVTNRPSHTTKVKGDTVDVSGSVE